MQKTIKKYVIENHVLPREREGVTRTYHVPSLGLTTQRVVSYDDSGTKTVSYVTEDRSSE